MRHADILRAAFYSAVGLVLIHYRPRADCSAVAVTAAQIRNDPKAARRRQSNLYEPYAAHYGGLGGTKGRIGRARLYDAKDPKGGNELDEFGIFQIVRGLGPGVGGQRLSAKKLLKLEKSYLKFGKP
jgi:hypothetical protein